MLRQRRFSTSASSQGLRCPRVPKSSACHFLRWCKQPKWWAQFYSQTGPYDLAKRHHVGACKGRELHSFFLKKDPTWNRQLSGDTSSRFSQRRGLSSLLCQVEARQTSICFCNEKGHRELQRPSLEMKARSLKVSFHPLENASTSSAEQNVILFKVELLRKALQTYSAKSPQKTFGITSPLDICTHATSSKLNRRSAPHNFSIATFRYTTHSNE